MTSTTSAARTATLEDDQYNERRHRTIIFSSSWVPQGGMRDLAHLRARTRAKRIAEKCANCSTNELPPAFLYISSFDPSRRAAAKAPSPKRSARLYTRDSFTVMIRAYSRAE